MDHLEANGFGKKRIQFKLRDWLISRQRYWGAPIPVVFCKKCGIVPVPESELPVKLPEKVKFQGTGESPLTTNPEWMNTKCPACGGQARREADTMDTFVCSSWYYLRYPSPHLGNAAFDRELVKKWLPVDQYVGGAEHAVMHLLYARFFTKVLNDLGWLDFDEPFTRLIHQGVITNAGAKMSKSRGNVINPDEYLRQYGSDVFRLYMMFMGSYTEGGDWSDEGIHGIDRFVQRVWRLVETLLENPPAGAETGKIQEVERVCHYSIKSASQDLERFQFNTAISRIMELVNAMYLYIQDVRPQDQNQKVLGDIRDRLILLLAPFAPHLAEELWEKTGHRGSLFNAPFPAWDESKLKSDTVSIAVQINGRVRDEVSVKAGAADEEVKAAVLASPRTKKHIEGKTVVKVVVVRNKLVSIVLK